MISRHWTGLAKPPHADEYVQHLHSETFPALARIPGFIDVSLMRRRLPHGVEFVVMTRWESLQAIQQFAGGDAETAVVPENVKRWMIGYDRRARHYEVVV